MNEFLDIFLDALKDSALLLPILLVVYFLIEFLEYKKVLEFEKSTLLTGKASPALGALFGSVPQCGFSVVSAELYSKQKISIAALIAVFIATSDEALPIMIANYKAIPALLLLIVTKILIAIIVGYITMFAFAKIFKQKKQIIKEIKTEEHEEEHKDHNDEHEHEHIHACCHHDISDQNKFHWKHPLVHSLKIFTYIFIVNLIMGVVVHLIGEQNIANFLNTSSAFQPLFALLVGLIPNCASSVILTEMYIGGMISFGSIVTGLCVNAGIGILVLFKENKKIKENLFIVLTLIVFSLSFGYALHFIPLDFLLL